MAQRKSTSDFNVKEFGVVPVLVVDKAAAISASVPAYGRKLHLLT